MKGFEKTDGGRSQYLAGSVRDCVCRAITIAEDSDYKTMFELLNRFCQTDPFERHRYVGRRRYPYTEHGLFPGTHTRFLEDRGWKYVKTTSKARLPMRGRVILHLTHHLAAMVDGVVMDKFDCRRKHLKGYYVKAPINS